jgi:hypothetical protein
MVKKVHSPTAGDVNGVASREAAFVGSSPEYAMNFDLKDVVDLHIAEFALPQAPKMINGKTPKPRPHLPCSSLH